MRYTEFQERARKALREQMGNGYDVSIQKIVKSNGCLLDAFIIKKRSEREQAIPVLYLNQYYEFYNRIEDMEVCVMKIQSDYEAVQLDKEKVSEAMRRVEGWDTVKDRIYPALVSRKGNEEMLSGLVYRYLLDLAVYYIIRIEGGGTHNSIKIKKSMCSMWGVGQQEIHEQAVKNMKLDGYQVKGMGSVIQELIMEDGIPVMPEEQEDMFVLTNREMWYGAAGMLLDAEFMSMKFGRRNFYILPSSVHECATRFAA